MTNTGLPTENRTRGPSEEDLAVKERVLNAIYQLPNPEDILKHIG